MPRSYIHCIWTHKPEWVRASPGYHILGYRTHFIKFKIIKSRCIFILVFKWKYFCFKKHHDVSGLSHFGPRDFFHIFYKKGKTKNVNWNTTVPKRMTPPYSSTQHGLFKRQLQMTELYARAITASVLVQRHLSQK